MDVIEVEPLTFICTPLLVVISFHKVGQSSKGEKVRSKDTLWFTTSLTTFYDFFTRNSKEDQDCEMIKYCMSDSINKEVRKNFGSPLCISKIASKWTVKTLRMIYESQQPLGFY